MALELRSGLSISPSFLVDWFWRCPINLKVNIYFIVGSASVVEESFGYLDAPVERIAGADVPMPYAANLERMAVPQVHFPTFSKSPVSILKSLLYFIRSSFGKMAEIIKTVTYSLLSKS